MVELRERLWETLRSQWEDLYIGTVPPFSPACDVKNQPLPQLSSPSLSNGEERISMAKVITPCCFCYSVPKWLNHQFLPGKVPSSNLKSSVLLQSFAASLWRVGKPGYLHEKNRAWISYTEKGCRDACGTAVSKLLTALNPCCYHYSPTIPDTRIFPRSNTKCVTSSVTATLSVKGKQESIIQCLNILGIEIYTR